MQLFQDCRCFFQCRSVIIGKTDIDCFSTLHCACQRSHCLFKRSFRIHSVMIKNIDVFQSHSFQALIKTCKKIFAASPVPVRALPHIISCFCCDNQLISVNSKILFQNTAKVLLGASRFRSVIICKVKLCNSVVKCSKTEFSHILIICCITKIVPQSQRHLRKH